MKKYRLIKSYPGSPKLGTEVNFSERWGIYNYNGGNPGTEIAKENVENNPDFWEEVKEARLAYLILADLKTMVEVPMDTLPIRIPLLMGKNKGRFHDAVTDIWYFSDNRERLKFYADIKCSQPLLDLCGIKLKAIEYSWGKMWQPIKKEVEIDPANHTLYCVDKKTFASFEVKLSVADCEFTSNTEVFSTPEERESYLQKHKPIDISEAFKPFITEIWYCVDKDFNPLDLTTLEKDTRAHKVYASKERRDKYILENKPQFSMLDMISFAKSFDPLSHYTDKRLRDAYMAWCATRPIKKL